MRTSHPDAPLSLPGKLPGRPNDTASRDCRSRWPDWLTGRSIRPKTLNACRTLQDEWRDRLDSIPETLRDTPYGERLQIVADADIEALEDIEPPRGYGRDT